MVDIDTSHKAVWVNDSQGGCVGRFGMYGVDIHRTTEEQVEGSPQCLACIHTELGKRTTEEHWQRFRDLMLQLHGVSVPDGARPGFLREAPGV